MRKSILIFFAAILSFLNITTSAQAEKYLREVLPSGLTVIIKHNPDSRVFAVDILGKNRAAWESVEQAGITDLVNRLLVKGTINKNAEEVQAALDDIGAKLMTNDNPYIPYDDRYTWRAFSFFRFETIDEYAEDGLKLLSEIIVHPAFSETELEKMKSQVMGIMGMESGSTYKTCRNLYYSKLFENHPLAKDVIGTRQTIARLTSADLSLYHRKYYAAGNLIMAVVSNVEPKTVLKWIKKYFNELPSSKIDRVKMPSAGKTMGKIEVKEPMEKEQVYIYLGNITPGLVDEDAAALTLAVEILSSRLGLTLREEKGLAYSVGAGIRFLENFGWYSCSIGTGYENFQTALSGILEEMTKLKNDPIPQAELDKARNSLWGSMLMRNLSCINQAYNMAYYEFVKVGYDYDDGYKDRLDKVTVEDVRNAAIKYLDTENYIMAFVGKAGE